MIFLFYITYPFTLLSSLLLSSYLLSSLLLSSLLLSSYNMSTTSISEKYKGVDPDVLMCMGNLYMEVEECGNNLGRLYACALKFEALAMKIDKGHPLRHECIDKAATMLQQIGSIVVVRR